MSTNQHPPHRIAILSAASAVALSASQEQGGTCEIQLTPCGKFAARGHGEDGGDLILSIDAVAASAIIEAVSARKTPLVLDYEHQTIRSEDNGQPAPAAGFFKKLEWREGVGLFAVDVKLTDNAKAMIQGGEYAYISPVLGFNDDGVVDQLFMAALTNFPAIDGMQAVVALSAITKGIKMENQASEILERFRYILNLPALATFEEIMAEMEKLKSLIIDAPQNAPLSAGVAAMSAKIASPDASKFAPIALLQEANQRVAALTAELSAVKAEKAEANIVALVDAAIKDGKITPAQKDWAVSLGKSNTTSLTEFIGSAHPIVQTQSQGQGVGGKGGKEGSTDTAASIVALSHKYIKEQAAAGITVSAQQAIAFVMKGAK